MSAKIQRVIVTNYRVLRATTVEFNPEFNIVVGDNETGKSTLLEAVHLALTNQLNGRSIKTQLHPHMFNRDSVADFLKALKAGTGPEPLKIEIEVYFDPTTVSADWKGTNNSLREDIPGVRLTIRLDDDLADEYSRYIQENLSTMTAVPVEYYTVEWKSFADAVMFPRKLPAHARLIDPSTIVVERGSSRYIQDVINDQLDQRQQAQLAIAYRALKESFAEEANVASLNDRLRGASSSISDKLFTISLDTTSNGSWLNSVVALLDDVPLQYVGKGEQAALKIRLALDGCTGTDIVLIEEPENHQSHSRLCNLLNAIRNGRSDKQVIVATHSSFVLNKLGLSETIMFSKDGCIHLTDIPKETQEYFQKLPGHSTLRLILAKRAILVEGPSDELIVQKAFKERYGKLPLDAGVEVISVGGLAFLRFIDIAKALGTEVSVVTDNDGKSATKRARYTLKPHPQNIRLCISDDDSMPSLEHQMANANGLAVVNAVLGRSFRSIEEATTWMAGNKTDAALAFFDTPESVRFPDYIEAAIDC